jgi:hypothetical protein
MRGSLLEFDRHSAFWAFDFVSNWMTMNWRNMSTEEVFPLQKKFQDEIDFQLTQLNDDKDALTAWQREIQKSLVSRWWDLADRLIVKYNDGYYTRVDSTGMEIPIIGKSYGYPDWFSKMIGQSTNPHPVWVQPWNSDRGSNGPAIFANSIDALPQDIYSNNYRYQVPEIFDFETKQWIWEVSQAAASATVHLSESGNFGTIIISLIIGFGVGVYASNYKRSKRGVASSPLLG